MAIAIRGHVQRCFCPSAQPMNTPMAAIITLKAMLHRPILSIIPGMSSRNQFRGDEDDHRDHEHGSRQCHEDCGEVGTLVSHSCCSYICAMFVAR